MKAHITFKKSYDLWYLLIFMVFDTITAIYAIQGVSRL
jgi:hypothetical protein